MNRRLLLIIFSEILTLVAWSQDFLQKDSSNLIPFHARYYYETDYENIYTLAEKTRSHHILTSPYESYPDGVLFGSFGSTGFPFLYSNTFSHKLTLGRDAVTSYYYNQDNIPHYLINKPLSELDFIFFGNGNEEFKGFFSQNLSKKLHIALGIRRSNNKGFFLHQENLHNNIYFHTTYQGKRLRSHLGFYYNDITMSENGGITYNIYDSLPPTKWQNATPRLQAAVNRAKNFQLSWNNRILLVPSAPIDTNALDTFIFKPKSSNLYLDINTSYGSDRMTYFDNLVNNRSFYEIYGQDTSIKTLEFRMLNYQLQNQSSITYTLPRRFSITGYSYLSDNTVWQDKTQFGNLYSTDEFIFGLGGKLKMWLPYGIHVQGELYKSISGYTQRDFLIRGEARTKISDHIFRFLSQYSRQVPGYFYSNMISSAYTQRLTLNTQNTLENSLFYSNEKWKLNTSLQSFLIEDFLFYDSIGTPYQASNNFLQFQLKMDWGFRFLYFPTALYFQNSMFPRSFVRQTIAYRNTHFQNHLNLIVGFDISLNLNMPSMTYQPFLAQSLYNPNAVESKLYPKVDFFATMKISKVHLSFIIDNFMSTYMQTGTNYNKNAPLTPSAFFLRSSWMFLE